MAEYLRVKEFLREQVSGEGAMSKTDAVVCPKCGEKLRINPVVLIDKDSRMQFIVAPVDGAIMDAKGVGQILASMAKLMVAIGNDTGVKTSALLEKVSTGSKGELKFDLLIARHAAAVKEMEKEKE